MPKTLKNLKSLLKCKFCRRRYQDDEELKSHLVSEVYRVSQQVLDIKKGKKSVKINNVKKIVKVC